MTTLLCQLLQKKIDEGPLEEATVGSMLPVNDLIGGISPRQIPVANTLLADLCKVSVE